MNKQSSYITQIITQKFSLAQLLSLPVISQKKLPKVDLPCVDVGKRVVGRWMLSQSHLWRRFVSPAKKP
jgi:hypothetical protein